MTAVWTMFCSSPSVLLRLEIQFHGSIRPPGGALCSAQPQQRPVGDGENWETAGTNVYEFVASVGSASHPRMQTALGHMRIWGEERLWTQHLAL